MKVVIIDGQGGRVGALLCETVKAALPDLTLLAIGTNATATAAMLRAGADAGATGENPVIVAARDADVIIGPIGIMAADALLGEVTPAMAAAVGSCRAEKLLLPLCKCGHRVVGTKPLSVTELVAETVECLKSLLQ